jgi:hypothetical protein
VLIVEMMTRGWKSRPSEVLDQCGRLRVASLSVVQSAVAGGRP